MLDVEQSAQGERLHAVKGVLEKALMQSALGEENKTRSSIVRAYRLADQAMLHKEGCSLPH